MESAPSDLVQAPPNLQPVADPPLPRPDAAALGPWERAALTMTHAAISALLGLVSLRGLYRFGRFFGTLEWLINYNRRRRFAAVLRRVLGREPTATERRRWTHEHFIQTRCDKLLYLIFDRIADSEARSLLTLVNGDLLDAALGRGHGAYVAVAHHGALHVVALLMALRGYKVAGVRDRREGPLRRYVQERLDRRQPPFERMRVLYADSFPREIYRCFQAGFLLASAMDVSRVRAPNQKTEEVTVFGESRAFLSGPVRIALRCGAPVLQAFITSEPGFRYRLEFVGVLAEPHPGHDEESLVAAAMRTYAANVERHIRTSPSAITRT